MSMYFTVVSPPVRRPGGASHRRRRSRSAAFDTPFQFFPADRCREPRARSDHPLTRDLTPKRKNDMEHNGQGAGTRGWLALAVLALPSLVMAMDMTALLLALPQLSTDLGADGTEQL